MNSSTQQRRDQILTEVYANGRVMVKELAGRMDVSEATVRRDLRALADDRRLELVYGGATVLRNSDYSFRSKSQRNVDAKKVIGRLAAGLVADDAQIFIDSGTTCFEMIPFLKTKRALSVIVNSARAVQELADGPGIHIITLGGQYRPERMDTIGPLATNTLDQLRGYIALIGADGLSMDFGLTASDIDSAHLNRLAARNAGEVILLADRSKFLSPSLYRIVDWDAISRVVTDEPPNNDWQQFFESQGIEVLCPDTESVAVVDQVADSRR